jgi:hypothetical protein
MTNKRRITIITVSVIIGTLLSAGLFFMKRRGALTSDDYFFLATNMFFSLMIIFTIGWFLVWRKKK